MTTFNAKVRQEEDGSYWAEVEELPGCFASGTTLDELKEALVEAISLYLSDTVPNGGGGGKVKPRKGDIDGMRVLVA